MFSCYRSSLLLLASVALLSLAACGSNRQPDDEAAGNPALIDLAPVPPPAISEEPHDPIKNPRTQIWRPGHWEYHNQRFEWTPGEILNRPSDTAVWSADRWDHRQYGWAFVRGYWQ